MTRFSTHSSACARGVSVFVILLWTGPRLLCVQGRSASMPRTRPWGLTHLDWQQDHRPRLTQEFFTTPLHIPRGGALEEDSEYDTYDSEYDAYDEEEDTTDEEEDSAVQVASAKDVDYVDPVYPSPMLGMYSTIGIMMLSRRLDLFSPRVVKIARFAFIAYIIALQLFIVYVRFCAKAANDQTPIQMSNPLSGLLAQQAGGNSAGAGMMKSLASSFLASQSTVMEYDLSQARNMQGGILFNLAFMWFLHFKMEQVQPLILSTVNGFINLIYSPLFQVYVMGRNLERPFKTQQAIMAEKMKEDEAKNNEDVETENSESVDTKSSAVDDQEIVDEDNDSGAVEVTEDHEESIEAVEGNAAAVDDDDGDSDDDDDDVSDASDYESVEE